MTRANPIAEEYSFYPEIERTGRRLRQRIRASMKVQNQQPRENDNIASTIDAATIRVAVNPPLPTPARAQTIRDYLSSRKEEHLDGLTSTVAMPEIEVYHFELKLVMFNMINTLGQFGASTNVDARQHLKYFLEICNSFRLPGVSVDVLKLKRFPYSLKDRAKSWLNNLSFDSLQLWTELCRSFLARFIYTKIIDKIRNKITYFGRCLMHGLPKWIPLSIFYNSVNTPTKMMLYASTNGTLLEKPPHEGLEILNILTQNDYQHPTTRR
ncbi:hypothetical protein GQ457_06G014920 [Hibiscus cannabinus]